MYADSGNDHAFLILTAVGCALLVMGATDLLLAVIPLRVGNVEWEFGTISAVVNGMPVPAMGAALVAAGAMARDSITGVAAIMVWSVVLSALLLGCGVLFVLDIPVALRAVTEATAREPLKSAILKTIVGLVTYLALWMFLTYLCARFLRHTRTVG